MSYQGLILDFGGVVTTDLSAELSAFCIREGLDPGAFARVLNDDREGRNAFEDVESAKISQREFEATIGRLLGVADQHPHRNVSLGDQASRRRAHLAGRRYEDHIVTSILVSTKILV